MSQAQPENKTIIIYELISNFINEYQNKIKDLINQVTMLVTTKEIYENNLSYDNKYSDWQIYEKEYDD